MHSLITLRTYANSAESGSQATLWHGTSITALGTLGGSFSQALGINDLGQAVGFSSTAGNTIAQAVVWSGTTAIKLGALGWAVESYAEDKRIDLLMHRASGLVA